MIKKKPIHQLEVSLTVSIFKQGEYFVAYTPALDISTYGDNVEDAQSKFEELVDTFFDEFKEDQTKLDNVLESLGWTKNKSNWTPPVEVKHVQTSVTLPSFA